LRALIIAALIAASAHALSINITGAKLDGSFFSTAHIRHNKPFSCQAKVDDFKKVTNVFCSFSKRPNQTFQPISDRFFNMKSFQRNNRFYIEITPIHLAYLEPVCDNVTELKKMRAEHCNQSKHWIVLGYKSKRPLIEKDPVPTLGLNFPIKITTHQFPSVGSLDIAGNPIYFDEVKDVSDYVAIKKLYDSENYYDVISDVDSTLKKHPTSLFKSEMLLYKMRALFKLENYTDLNQLSKEFLRTFSSDKSVDEVLYLSAKANQMSGLTNDSNYFYSRLLDEHPNTAFASYGLIALGEQRQRGGESKIAEKLYKRALYETKDLDAASVASEHLYKLFSSKLEPIKAAQFMQKIINANAKYITSRPIESFENAIDLADKEQFSTAAKISSMLLDTTSPISELYEEYYRHKVIWTDQAGKKREAFDLYNAYLKKYEYGQYEQYMKQRRDQLFFALEEANVSKRLARYDELMEKYTNDEIANKALYKKALLLYEQKKYADVLGMQTSLNMLDKSIYEEIDNIIKGSAIELAQVALQNRECLSGIELMHSHDVNISNRFDDYLFECMIDSGKYKHAQQIAKQHLNEPSTKKRLKWLYGYMKTLRHSGEYAQMADIAQDVLTLSKIENMPSYKKVWYELFDAYSKLNNQEMILKTAQNIEKELEGKFENCEPYMQIVKMARDKKDNTMISTYAQKIISLQKIKNSFTYSPSIEFTLAQALMSQNSNKKAIEVLEELLKQTLKPEQNSRAYYLKGTLYQSLKNIDEAKTAYKKSKEASPDSAWGKLSKDSLELIQ